MSRALTIAAREIRERRFVFILAVTGALIPFASALLPYARTSGATAVIMSAALMVSAGISLALSIALGGSLLSRELAERRSSFYFSKPVSHLSIWFGKLTGAIVLVAVSFAIMFLPAFAVARDAWPIGPDIPVARFIRLVAIAAIAMMIVTHVLFTMIRSRSALIGLDLVLLLTSVAAFWLIVRMLLVNMAFHLAGSLIAICATLALLVAIAAGAWQVSAGRTEIKRSHRELSRFLWSGIALVLIAAGAFVGWVLSAGPRDLRIANAVTNARGDWAALTGRAKYRGDYAPAFLLNLRTGKSVRLVTSNFFSSQFTHNGDALIVPQPDLSGLNVSPYQELRVQTLTDPPSQVDTGVEVSPFAATVLSDDLRQLAVLEHALLSVYDVRAKALLASARLSSQGYHRMFFVRPGVVRLYMRNAEGASSAAKSIEIRIVEFDAASRQLQQTGAFSIEARSAFPYLSADASALFVRAVLDADQRKTFILDPRTGVERGHIDGGVGFATPLASGEIAATVINGNQTVVRIFDARGNALRDIALPGNIVSSSIRELQPGKSILVSVFRKMNSKARDAIVVDVQRNAIVRTAENVTPQVQFFGIEPRMPKPNVSGEYIVSDASEAFWRWNALTGERRPLF